MWFGRILCLISLFSLSGLDLSLLQAFAWSTMLADRAPERGLVEALESTFSGDEPCEMCEALAEPEPTQEPSAPPVEERVKLLSPVLLVRPSRINPPGKSWIGYRSFSERYRSESMEVPTPPPRADGGVFS